MQKCDAKRPCARCVEAESASECVYDDKIRSLPYSIVGPWSGAAHPAQLLVLRNPLTDDDVAPPAELDLPPPASDVTRVATYELAVLQAFEPVRIPRGHSSGPIPFRRNPPERHLSPDTNPSMSIISSFLSPKIPLEPWIPLSFLGEERLQVSGADTTDIDMRSCVFGLNYTGIAGSLTDASRLWSFLRLYKFGIHFKRERLEALIAGDLSGAVLDRFWVLGSHSFGMPQCLRMDATPGMIQLQARRTQIAWESLAELVKGNDHKLKVQAFLMLAASYIHMPMMQSAFLYIKKSCDFIKAGNLRFVPTYGRPPEFSEELHETLSALSQAIYWSNYSFLVCGGPEPRATVELEKEFRQELPVGDRLCQPMHRVDHPPQKTYPFLFKTCPLTIRTQGILFVRDVVLLISNIPANGEHNVSRLAFGDI